jgi:hypothetical protein
MLNIQFEMHEIFTDIRRNHVGNERLETCSDKRNIYDIRIYSKYMRMSYSQLLSITPLYRLIYQEDICQLLDVQTKKVGPLKNFTKK